MSLRPCSAHGARVDHKLCSVYWSWNLADRTRVAYLQRLCVQCYIQNVAPFEQQEFSETVLCPSCHSPTDDDMDPVYAMVYVPGQHHSQLELPMCATCAAELRIFAQTGAERLEDRNPSFGGQAPKRTGAEVWDDLGLAPSRRGG